MEEKHIFQTCYMLKGHCDKCGEDVTHLQNVILNYFAEIELNSIDNIIIPGNFKEWTTYTLPYFHKKRYNLRDSIFVDYNNKI